MIIFLIDSNDSNQNALILFAKKYFSTTSDNNELDIDINENNSTMNTKLQLHDCALIHHSLMHCKDNMHSIYVT